MLRRLRDESFDVLVIGGGITGVGVALDAATRGLSVALVERHDFASGTSSKSSKLIHGGLRYLQNGDVRLVYDALHERQRLLRNAPHLVHVLPFIIPVLTRDGLLSKKVAKALGSALWMYDLTGGWRIGKRHRRLSADETHEHAPTLPQDRLAGAYLYYDAEADDARLTLTVARTAARHGAVVVNRCAVTGLTKAADGTVDGATVDTGDGTIDVRASTVVSATGVWADQVDAMDVPVGEGTLRPAKGVHVMIPWDHVRNDVAVIIPVPKDRRSLFVIPAGRKPDGSFTHAYIGTTDTDYEGGLDEPTCTDVDVRYVLDALNHSITSRVTDRDVTAVWAGLRPLLKTATSGRTADLSRRHHVSVSESGVIRVAGGKLTTYREMAADTVDVVMSRLRRSRLPFRGRSRTARLQLMGAAGYEPPSPTGDPVDVHLAGRYGTQAADVKALIAFDRSLGEPLVEGLPYLRAEVVFAARHEMATTVADVLQRRTRAHLFDRAASLAAAPDVAALLAAELGWDDAERDREVAMYECICHREVEALHASGAAGWDGEP